MLDAALAANRYLVGGAFTVADLNVACVLSWVKMAGFDFSPFPRAKDWLSAALQRPAARTAALKANAQRSA